MVWLVCHGEQVLSSAALCHKRWGTASWCYMYHDRANPDLVVPRGCGRRGLGVASSRRPGAGGDRKRPGLGATQGDFTGGHRHLDFWPIASPEVRRRGCLPFIAQVCRPPGGLLPPFTRPGRQGRHGEWSGGLHGFDT
ncbi:hypothetical protein NDU88_002473 [Pleurodeles waltl]|uniref:Uncharacterized protein n=1 Tax=Pleurodeles waltl TaxID=8319 RepID=A0AAV7VAM6_PLEWA|nr:hypothetical protein NDU88_002473 [Pleurodeles waltl]